MTTPGPQSEARSAPIAQYLGRPVPGSVTFKGMQYRFA